MNSAAHISLIILLTVYAYDGLLVWRMRDDRAEPKQRRGTLASSITDLLYRGKPGQPASLYG